MRLNPFKYGKAVIHFMYKNQYIEVTRNVVEDDNSLTAFGRTITKKTSHAFIDGEGRKHYFVNGQSSLTSLPYKTYTEDAEVKELNREAVHATLKTNLLKTMAKMVQENMMLMVCIFIAGSGVGYMLGTEYGGDNYNQQSYTDNYYQDVPTDNGTVVITMMSIDLNQLNNLPEVNIWEALDRLNPI